MRTTTHFLGCTALVLALALTTGCGDDDDSGTAGNTASPDIVIPNSTCEADESLACGYDGECADRGIELDTCEVARCIDGCCAATAAPTFSMCEAQGAGPCEEGACSDSGACIVVTADDGKFCNSEMADACSSYTCSGGNCVANDLENCDDNNVCTSDTCVVTCVDEDCSASCTFEPIEDGAPCNDQNACTGADACAAGSCAGTEDLCECTVDADCAGKDTDLCDAVGLVCDVENSKCVDSAMDAVVCDAAELSTCDEVACEPSTGECVVAQKAEYATCDDGDPCTGCAPGLDECDNAHDYCNANGECQSGSGTPCSCTEDIDCQPLDDGDFCNGGYECIPTEEGEPGVCWPYDNINSDCGGQQAPVCHTLACTPETGNCDAFPAAEGAPCEPTPGAGAEYTCVAAHGCTAEQLCEATEYKEDGAMCGEAGETCQAGECTAPVVLTLCEQFCEATAANCTEANAIAWTVDCATDCAGWPEGEDGDTAANTTHCRLYHAGAAADDAALHCPHAAPDGGGVCVDPDPCDGVVCAEGETCEAGVCTAPVVATLCEQFCEATAANCTEANAIVWAVDCATDCAGWPEGEDGDTAANTTHCRLYHAGVAADDAALHCPHAAPDGGGVCVDPDPCDGVVCDAPPEAGCDGNNAVTYGAAGTCAAGVCQYTESSTDCGDDVCNAGACEPAAPAFQCDAAHAGCTEEDFNANDMTAMVGSIDVEIAAFAPYSPKCLRVAVGQTVNIEASGSHPFEKVCAEDTVMDTQDGNTSDVSFTFTTPGYYNYKCLAHDNMVGNIQVVSLD